LTFDCQVFHGADSDIVWLQQDFSVFVVGLFDTYHASKVLDFQKHGLANLLEAFCDFIPDKRYQLADWRIRYVEILSFSRRLDQSGTLFYSVGSDLVAVFHSPSDFQDASYAMACLFCPASSYWHNCVDLL